MKSIKEILEYTHRLKDNKNNNIETCKQNINNTKEQIKELENLIDVAEIEVNIEKFNNGKVELQNQKNALDLYSNQYDRLMNEASLNKEEAQEILDEFNNLIEKEDKKLNQEALQYIKALKELAEKSGVSRTVISQLENGKRDIVTSDTMKNIAEALGEPIGEIFLF